MVGWLVGWLVNRSVGRTVVGCVFWSVGRSVSWWVGKWVVWLVSHLVGWTVSWLVWLWLVVDATGGLTAHDRERSVLSAAERADHGLFGRWHLIPCISGMLPEAVVRCQADG